MNPALPDNRPVYSPGEPVRMKDGSLTDGRVILSNDTYKRAIVRWADAAAEGTRDRLVPYVALEKVKPFPSGDGTEVTGSPAGVGSSVGYSEAPFRRESLEQAHARRARVARGAPAVEFEELDLGAAGIPVYGGHPTWSGQPGGQPVAGPNDTQGQRPQQPPNLHIATPQGDTQYLTDQMCASCRWWDPENMNGYPDALDLTTGTVMPTTKGGCMKYRVGTGGEQVCDSWEGRAGYDLAVVVDEASPHFIGLSEDEDLTGERFTKVALRTGQLAAVTPDGQGRTVDRPLVVVDGPSERGPGGELLKIGMDDVLDSVNDHAFERITVPLSHADRPDENTGFVTRAWKEDDPKRPGEKQLVLEKLITEPDAAAKLKRKSIFGSSVGLVFDYVRKTDLKRFPVALKHNALTNVPWVRGLGTHAAAASESEVRELPRDVAGIPVRSVAFLHLAQDEHPLVKTGQALSDGQGGYRWPIRNASDLSNAKQAFGRAKESEKGKIKAWINKRAKALGKPGLGQTEPAGASASEPPSGGANENRGGDRMADGASAGTEPTKDPAVARMELRLSEQSDVVSAQQAEIDRLHRDLHRRNVDDRVAGWGSKGLDRCPAFLAEARRIMLEDDGGPAMVLNLSEEEGGRTEITASQIVERLVEALPFDETTGRLQLGEQAFAPDVALADGSKPPEHNPGVERELDNSPEAVKKRAEEAAADLGRPLAAAASGEAS